MERKNSMTLNLTSIANKTIEHLKELEGLEINVSDEELLRNLIIDDLIESGEVVLEEVVGRAFAIQMEMGGDGVG